ncbi:MAG: Maltodextrin phosphorylase [Syntrophus sp. PtaB.Bin001]|nr:MAG: Maltodextrin phosphorylase [Syntrophus sp. PtaB.Bin001]
MLYKMLNRIAWKESGHNPDRMLREFPRSLCETALRNPEYVALYERVLEQFRHVRDTAEHCFSGDFDGLCGESIAFFSAEYGLHHSLPFYAGGLGFLAGDYLKECSDLSVPLVAVGFMYPEGYVRQRIREDGWQESMAEVLDRDAASISRVLKGNGDQLVVKIPFMEPPIYVAVWKVAIGRISLYLMDTDIDINDPWNRKISCHLYIGGLEQRLRQEIVLGIGGAEVLYTLGIQHSVAHLNEGHPAFALLELVRQRVAGGKPLEEAIRSVRSTSIFTTHTPVPAGHDVFPFHLMEKYFSQYWPALGMDHDTFMKLGMHPEQPLAGFNMTVFALRMTEFHNGVSRRHGEVARRMWQSLWPELPVEKVPIDHITNGIHVPTWIEPKMELLFNRYLGKDWLEEHDQPEIWEKIADIPDRELWQTHYWLKMKLINTIREQVRRRWVTDRISPSLAMAGGTLLDPYVLTLGFARRFVTYKRADLIFHSLERLKKILGNRWRPVQIIFAGKAHPDDVAGLQLLQKVFNATRNPDLYGRIAFVEDYGEQNAQYMVHGVDVWLNNPLPPMEASGTSGMKAALNGVPHLSIPDGWWLEGYNGRNGWSFGEEYSETDRDAADAEDFYKVLEEIIVPLYYRVDAEGTPADWVKVMKESIRSNAPRFSTRRMVKEYRDKFYRKALENV